MVSYGLGHSVDLANNKLVSMAYMAMSHLGPMCAPIWASFQNYFEIVLNVFKRIARFLLAALAIMTKTHLIITP